MTRVLVIDDDPLFREIAQEILTQAGYEVMLADNGLAAAALPPNPAPDLAIVDMLMPERDGFLTIGDLKLRWPAVKLIAISGGARGLDASLLLRTAKGLGAHAALDKPVSSDGLVAAVRGLLA